MATSHDFLALPADFLAVEQFLVDHGAEVVGRAPESSTFVYGFPQIGPLRYWERHATGRHPDNSATWKAATLAELRRREAPDIPQVDELESPVAGVIPPEERVPGVWKSAAVWFPTPKLRERFPQLARVNGAFQRWLRRHPIVFDNTSRTTVNTAPQQLAGFSGLVIKVFALPAAAERLSTGGYFVHNLTSAKTFDEFTRQAALRGVIVAGGC